VALCGTVWRSSRSFHKQPYVSGSAEMPQIPIPIPHLEDKLQRLCFMSDRASKALAEVPLPGEPGTYDARSKRSGVPLTTLYYRNQKRPSKEQKAQGQQYLTPSEEKALEKYLKLMADLGNPLRIKCLSSLAFSIARRRSTTHTAPSLQAKSGLRAFRSVTQLSNHEE
jgi:hypothetical protein